MQATKTLNQVQNIAIIDISPWKLNPRSTIAVDGMAELSDSIKSAGMINPITVRPAYEADRPEMVDSEARYIIIAGERRLKAALLADFETVPAIVKDITREQALEIAIIENLQRDDISAIEEARAYQTYLTETKITQTELANKIGKSQAHIANRLRLLKLPDTVQDKIISGEITATDARDLATVADFPEVIEQAMSDHNSGRTMAHAVKIAKHQHDRRVQEAELIEKLRVKHKKAIEARIVELQAQGFTVYRGAEAPEIKGHEHHHYWQLCKRCDGCEKAIVVVDIWHTDWSGTSVKTELHCPDKKCYAAAMQEYNNRGSAAPTAEEKRKRALKKDENKRRSEKVSLFMVQAAAVNAELEHPEARLIAETLLLGYGNKDDRLRQVCEYMGWEIKGDLETTIRQHLTNDREKIILKAAALCLAIKMEEQLKRSDEPIKHRYAGSEMNCYFNWLAGRGYKVPTKLDVKDEE